MFKPAHVLIAAWLWLCWAWPVSAATSNETSSVSQDFVVEQMDIGLPQSSVISITQTRDGFLWMGTLKGLVRFDGIDTEVFDDENTPGLNSSAIVNLFEDSRSNLWVGTESAGIAVIQNGKVIPTGMGIQGAGSRLVSACEDARGTLWFYLADGGLWRFANGHADEFRVMSEGASTNRSVIAEKEGPMWVGTETIYRAVDPSASAAGNSLIIQQVLKVTNKLDMLVASKNGGYWRLADSRIQLWRNNQLVRDLGAYPWVTNASVRAACEDQEGNLIVGTWEINDGVYWFDAQGKAKHISHAEGLSHDGILSLCVDREGSLWVGTDNGGLNRVKRSFCRVMDASRERPLWSVAENSEGGLWIGGWGRGAIYFKDRLSNELVPMHAGEPAYVTCVLVDKSGRVWAGSRKGGLYLWQNPEFVSVLNPNQLRPIIYSIFQDRKGDVWVGGLGWLGRWDEQAWKLYNVTEGRPDAVLAIADDADGNLWIGTEGGGLKRLREESLSAFRKSDGLPGEKISALLVDTNNVLWVGTDGAGLARYQDGKWTRYSRQDGLPSDRIAYLIEDGKGDLWIGSNGGLTRVAKGALNDFAKDPIQVIPWRTYTKADGLPTLECSQGFQPAPCRTRTGVLWFPTSKGLVAVDPSTLKSNSNRPPVIIESVLVDGKSQLTNRLLAGRLTQVVVPPQMERLEIHFTSLNLSAPLRARFKYRLEGHETAWSPIGNLRVASYIKLPPDTYTFHVAACNEDGLWNEEGASLAIVVQPAFWQTWWFRAFVVLDLLGLIAGVVYYVSTQKLQRQVAVLRQQEALEKERARIARDLHDQLGANLTQVALLGEMVEEDKALPNEVESHAQQISQTARETSVALDEIVWAANPANDTLDSLTTYACKYAQDYLSLAGLRHRLEVPTHLPETPLAPDLRHNVFLAFKESINNVVKHAQASEARIRLKLEDTQFTWEIEDNGRGPADAEKKTGRNGLRNMRKRMEDVGGGFSIGPAAERGTLVRLTAPLGKN